MLVNYVRTKLNCFVVSTSNLTTYIQYSGMYTDNQSHINESPAVLFSLT